MTAGWALAVALTSLVTATVSLGWQVVTWRLGRPVVKVEAGDYESAGSTEAFTVIRTQNVGGMPVTLTACGFQQQRRPRGKGKNAWVVLPLEGAGGHSLPHRLEPGDEALFLLTADRLKQPLISHGGHPWVALATGKVVVGKRYQPGRDVHAFVRSG